ncbi:MAG: hypothetical protein H7X92_12720 [Chitinophagales bacterium]|nr:hypothetical protein [Hyphomicrobiales bacterium]
MKPAVTAKSRLIILGIETSCDETAAAVVARAADGRGAILSNVIRSQIAEHADYGGVVPEIAARAHLEVLDTIILAALADAGVSLDDIDGVAATLTGSPSNSFARATRAAFSISAMRRDTALRR